MKACVFDASSTRTTVEQALRGEAPTPVLVAGLAAVVFVTFPVAIVVLCLMSSSSESSVFEVVDWTERLMIHLVPAFVVWAAAAYNFGMRPWHLIDVEATEAQIRDEEAEAVQKARYVADAETETGTEAKSAAPGIS